MSLPNNFKVAAVSVNASGDNTAIAGVAGQVIRVYAIALTGASAVTMAFKDGTAGTTLGTFQSATSVVLDLLGTTHPRYTCSSGNGFVVNLASGVTCSGSIWYIQE